jgi:PEP-CTERM motif-containing protein
MAKPVVFILFVAVLIPGFAKAAPVEFIFSGVVTETTDANNLLAGGFQPGTAFSGNVFYDTATASPDGYPDNPGLAVYGFSPAFAMSVSAGAHRFDSTFSSITVIDAPPSGTSTDNLQYTAIVDSYDGVLLPATFTTRYYGVAFITRLFDVGVITGDGVPTAIPSVADFETSTFALDCRDPATSVEFLVMGRITAITPVPEPSTITLWLVGVLTLILARRKLFRL